jgi:AraC-like DNA-binding protein
MEPRIRTATLAGYAALARSLGLDPGALMAGVGLDVADLDASDQWVPAAPAARLLELSARESGCDDFGVRLSRARLLGALGPLSVVVREEPDLEGALALLIDYERAYSGILDLRLIRDEDAQLATVQVRLEFGVPVPTRQALDLTAGNLISTFRILLRSDWEPQTACFAHPAPRELETFRQVFGSRLRFDQEFTGLVFPIRELAARVTSADASVRPYAQPLLGMLLQHRGATVSSQARDVVEFLLPLGRSSVDEVARLLGLSGRALRRELAEDGESFSSVVHATRARLAEHHLANPRYSLTDVSQLLGFAAPSAFTRWFAQRFGMTPTAWRQAAGNGHPHHGDHPGGMTSG